MPEYCHLHCHTGHSTLDGAMSVEHLVDAVASMGMKAVALTDHGYVYGLPELQKVCRAKGVKPILGVELYLVPSVALARETKSRKRYHQLILAKTDEGYKNLIRLASWAATEGFYHKPLVDFERLLKHRDGLILTSTCMQGIIPRTILGDTPETEGLTQAMRLDKATEMTRWFVDAFGGDFYLEAHRHDIEDEERIIIGIQEIAKRLGVEVTTANDCHYVHEEDFDFQDALTCIDRKILVSDPTRYQIAHRHLSVKTPDAMIALLPEFPGAADVTMSIADKCSAEIHFDGEQGVYHFPTFPLPSGVGHAHEYLRSLCGRRFHELYPGAGPEVGARVRHELGVIQAMGFADYFLIVADLVAGARSLGVPVGPGRGSAAGSIVAYLLGITGIDPVEHRLLFERFINPERVSMPDIDIDFADEKRALVFEYLRKRYGSERTSQVSTSTNLKPRAAIRDFGRVHGLNMSETISVTKLFPDNPVLVGQPLREIMEASHDVREAVEAKTAESAAWARVFEHTEKAYNFPRGRGLHAAALLITPGPVEDYIPVQRKGKAKDQDAEVDVAGEGIMTQYPGDLLDSFGLLKMDILGLKTLSVIERAIELVEASGQTLDRVAAGMTDGNPFSDPAVYQLFQRGATVGVFQFESAGMQQWLEKLRPTEFNDLIAMNALYRPGPMDYIPDYVKRKNGEARAVYPHPALESVLADTYGIFVYQEQVMEGARVMAGYSLGQADLLRRAMGKKKLKEMVAHRETFRDGAERLHGLTSAQADEIFDTMETFAAYAFNKPHAAAYSMLAYQTAYLKAHYPVEFAAGSIEKEDREKRPQVLENVIREGYDVLSPDVNCSGGGFSVEREHGRPQIRFGLGSIKDVGAEGHQIVDVRERGGQFADFDDVVRRSAPRLNVLRSLIQAGALDSVQTTKYPNRATMFEAAKELTEHYRQVRLFHQGRRKSAPFYPPVKVRPEWPATMRLFQEKDVTGAFVSGHPLDPYREFIDAVKRREDDHMGGSHYRYLTGVVTAIKTRKTKTGKGMWFVTFSDGTKDHELTMFEDTHERYGAFVGPEQAVFVVAKNGKGSWAGKFSVEAILPLDEALGSWTACLHVETDSEAAERAVWEACEPCPSGAAELWTTIDGKTHRAPAISVSPSRALLAELRAIGPLTLAF